MEPKKKKCAKCKYNHLRKKLDMISNELCYYKWKLDSYPKTGPQGPSGLTGLQGFLGFQGPQGPRGIPSGLPGSGTPTTQFPLIFNYSRNLPEYNLSNDSIGVPFEPGATKATIYMMGGGGGGGAGAFKITGIDALGNRRYVATGGGGGSSGQFIKVVVPTLSGIGFGFRIGEGGRGGRSYFGTQQIGENGSNGSQTVFFNNGFIVAAAAGGIGGGGAFGSEDRPRSGDGGGGRGVGGNTVNNIVDFGGGAGAISFNGLNPTLINGRGGIGAISSGGAPSMESRGDGGGFPPSDTTLKIGGGPFGGSIGSNSGPGGGGGQGRIGISDFVPITTDFGRGGVINIGARRAMANTGGGGGGGSGIYDDDWKESGDGESGASGYVTIVWE